MTREHHFESHLVWQGSTAQGYQRYGRDHRVRTPPATAELAVSAAPAFKGDPSLVNPEQLVLTAASSCQLLSFLAEAARAGIEVLDYSDDAEAVMPVTREPMRIATIVLRPTIVVAAGTDEAAVHKAVADGHDQCFIANSLNTDVVVEATVVERS